MMASRLNGYGLGWTLGVGDGQGGLACCGSWGCKESDTTELLSLQTRAITNLDSVLKSKDITLPTKIHRVQAILFPMVAYDCESWIIKRQSVKELMLSNCDARKDS